MDLLTNLYKGRLLPVRWSILILVWLVVIPLYSQKRTPSYLDGIVQKLYENSGYPNIRKPQIRIVPGKEFAARYLPLKNEIHLEDSLMHLCRSFGKDSLNALAFIIAHEYSHALLHKDSGNLPSHFVQSHWAQTGKAIDEFASDIYGLFMSYMAGYQPENILKKLLEEIYQVYQISNEGNASYPSLSQRLQSQKILYHRILPFLYLFDAANILTVKGYYDLAAACYERILKIYRGVEIYNNLGVIYTLRALENFDEDLDTYAYPIELDYNTGLKKIKKSRGPLPPEMQADRKKWLTKAKLIFQQAMLVNENYQHAHYNFICALLLSGEPTQSLKYIQSLAVRKKEFSKSRQLDLLKGINFALLQDSRAHLAFKEASKTRDPKLSRYAAYNLKVLKGGSPISSAEKLKAVDCGQWQIKEEDNVAIKREFVGVDTIGFEFEGKRVIFRAPNTHSKSFYFFEVDSKTFLGIQYHFIKNDHFLKKDDISKHSAPLKWIEGFQGSFVECEATGYVYLLENQNRNLKGIELRIF